ncbi:MAG: DUF2520 domain-containing protein [Chloroflexota bacterium]
MIAKIGVIGANGRVGSTIAAKARSRGALAFSFARKPLEGALADYSMIDRFPDVTFIAVSDYAINEIAERIAAESKAPIAGKIFAHCAGSLSLSPLAPLKERGARIAAAHPYQTFYRLTETLIDGIAWGVECDEEEFPAIAAAVETLNGFAFRLPGGIDRQKYHASAVAASNFATCAIGLGRELARQCGLPINEFFSPILKQTYENNLSLLNNSELPLSGPIARGDAAALERHLDSMKDDPELQSAYREFAAAAQVIYKIYQNL